MLKPQSLLLKRISQLFSYSRSDLWVFVASWFIYLKWDILISVVNYKEWSKHLLNQNSKHNQTSVNVSNTINISNVRQLIRINETASRNHIRKMNCLRRCLCQKELLNNRSIQTKLHIGVKFVEGKLAAHSWLTHNNETINDSAEILSTYTELTHNLDEKTLTALTNMNN